MEAYPPKKLIPPIYISFKMFLLSCTFHASNFRIIKMQATTILEKDSQKDCVHACKKSPAIKKSKPSKNEVIFTGNNHRFPCFFKIDEIAFVQ